jgi:hypothetical protein
MRDKHGGCRIVAKGTLLWWKKKPRFSAGVERTLLGGDSRFETMPDS